jgi:hypothetical protein
VQGNMRVLSTREKKHFYFLGIVAPADGIKAAYLRSSDFGTSPFYGQLSVKRLLDLYG